MSATVAIRGLSFRYPETEDSALDSVDLDVEPGSVLTVVGPSGSGKSTLLAVLSGMEAPSEGRIEIDGKDVTWTAPGDRRVALMMQQPYLFPHMSVGDNVTFAMAARGVKRRERVDVAERWLSTVGLAGMASRRPRQLSGGEQQRVALVRALAAEPRVLALDEPLTGLDPHVRAAMQEVIRELVQSTGVTTVMVTHDLSEAMALGDRTAILLDGRIVGDDVPRRIFNSPPGVDAARFVGMHPILTGTLNQGVLSCDGTDLDAPRFGRGSSGPAVAGVRPEHLRRVDGPGANVVSGSALRSVFRGEYWEITVLTSVGELTVRCSASAPDGDAIHVHLPPHDIVPLERPGRGEVPQAP